ncbi:hypothetical protein PAXRUDRAFT_159379 [Paxillus rubicundulus Ve08.2h10]|uniref:Secreted protein n=1 Tax=Paxillus rubicundulus Ve08.2h10 TaxID=930991 RepID=A0A0D0CBE4_9AGAM|nr:hypothetical protein PAXRUDRAFT_159379 [Paxillus rubicundulus Ve08.2h10]
MKSFLTLFAAIISLGAYTLVGVHAGCAVCPTPSHEAGFKFRDQCITDGITTQCSRYQNNGPNGSFLYCYYNVRTRSYSAFQFDLTIEFSFLKPHGSRDIKGSDARCPESVQMGKSCSKCSLS